VEFQGISGLSNIEVQSRKLAQGVPIGKRGLPGWIQLVLKLLKEPMILMLLLASTFYLSRGEWQDALFLSISVIMVASISLFQDSRSRKAIDTLKVATALKCKVIRDGVTIEVFTKELVTDDALIIEEGDLIQADGIILNAHDFLVNESVLTGESFPIAKSQNSKEDHIYQGSFVARGQAVIRVTATGQNTMLNGIGQSIDQIQAEKSPLEKQINNFVGKMTLSGAIVFILVWLINYMHSFNFTDSLLKALTLAMSILPEEIPVAFATFMAMGAWKLLKIGVLVKDLKTVEALGSATVICIDKTGTITQNKMDLAKIWSVTAGRIINAEGILTEDELELVETAMWASEPIPFDPMEKAIHNSYSKTAKNDRRSAFKMIHEYPLSGKPPMMTHIFANKDGQQIIACKGAPEAILAVCGKSSDCLILKAIDELTSQGYRVLGVAETLDTLSAFPAMQQDISFTFKGLISFYDPPKPNISEVLESFYKAGIKVKIITGDGPLTSATIARQIGFKGVEKSVDGEEVMSFSDRELQEKVLSFCLFTRMFPEAKLRVINALKDCNEVVAMTGDGVNDGPALKAAHIGIAMGRNGTEIAREAARLILIKDDLLGMVDAIALGRRIYSNLKKAIRYIISIHIPIILIVFIPLILNWVYPNIFSPIHIIFLELVMGPTCSLIYENEPTERNAMNQKPRRFTSTFFSLQELAVSLIQGLVITAVVLLLYYITIKLHFDIATIRSMVFTALITANITLTLVNRSFHYSVLKTLKYKNNLVPLIIAITTFLLLITLYFEPLSRLFGFAALNFYLLIISSVCGILSVLWYELVKWHQRSFSIVVNVI
jgi:Ca2+-transporting ATPase